MTYYTKEQKDTVRRLLLTTNMQQKDISELTGVKTHTVCQISKVIRGESKYHFAYVPSQHCRLTDSEMAELYEPWGGERAYKR